MKRGEIKAVKIVTPYGAATYRRVEPVEKVISCYTKAIKTLYGIIKTPHVTEARWRNINTRRDKGPYNGEQASFRKLAFSTDSLEYLKRASKKYIDLDFANGYKE